MRRPGAFILLGSAAVHTLAASEPSRPRGVGPEFAKFYRVQDTFTCISAPSITIPYSQVNDDYCDCPDGSDEPGTSACSYISPLSAPALAGLSSEGSNFSENTLPGFYCKNRGHRPSYVPFSNINDGVCDYALCCDGSDEWAGVGGIKCEDRCKEIGKEWRKQEEIKAKALGAANRKRKELVGEAERLRKEVEDRIGTLQTQIQGDEVRVKALEEELKEVERREKGRVVRAVDGSKGGKLGILVGLARERINELRDHLVRVKGDRDVSRSQVQELEAILSKFKEEYNPNFNDEGVKRAVRAWEDYSATVRPPVSEALDRDLDETLNGADGGIQWQDFEDKAEPTDVDVLYQFEEYLPKPLRVWVDQRLRDLRVLLIDNGILAAPKSDSGESKPVSEARDRLNAAQSDLSNAQGSLNSHREDLARDYGPEGVFRALKGQCVSKDSGEYTYEFCFMDSTTQKPKKGGGHTGMGNFVRIERVTVDEELPADGNGLGSGHRIAMKHENGQHCWNGPNRSTTVILACAENNELWKIVEEEKCVYRMEVGTPAVCEAGAPRNHDGTIKDEL